MCFNKQSCEKYFFRRMLAIFIDIIFTYCIAIIGMIISVVFKCRMFSYVFAILISYCYLLFKDSFKNGSLGKRILKLKIVNFNNRTCSLLNSVMRNFYATTMIIFGFLNASKNIYYHEIIDVVYIIFTIIILIDIIILLKTNKRIIDHLLKLNIIKIK